MRALFQENGHPVRGPGGGKGKACFGRQRRIKMIGTLGLLCSTSRAFKAFAGIMVQYHFKLSSNSDFPYLPDLPNPFFEVSCGEVWGLELPSDHRGPCDAWIERLGTRGAPEPARDDGRGFIALEEASREKYHSCRSYCKQWKKEKKSLFSSWSWCEEQIQNLAARKRIWASGPKIPHCSLLVWRLQDGSWS